MSNTTSPFTNAPTDKVSGSWFTHSSSKRTNTDAYIYDIITTRHPGLTVTIIPEFNANLLAYAAANPTLACSSPVDDHPDPTHQYPSNLKWTYYLPPQRRLPGSGPTGQVAQENLYDSFLYTHSTNEFLVYLIDCRDGQDPYPQIRNQYVVSSSQGPVLAMLREIGEWSSTLHDEIWVFNQGFWSKSAELYEAIMKSRWEDVILPPTLKKEVRDVATKFFAEGTRRTYHRLRVPWKRGIIFYGPPGNGKTISIKATIHTLYTLSPPIPTLYVKSLASFGGPEYSISQIFDKARSYAPCYLVFEDLDSLVTDDVRSFFLNAVDGVSENEGILMVGSTNHLEKLDDGIRKRPSRFDRKYLFGLPEEKERRRYVGFWQGKLKADEGGKLNADVDEELKDDRDDGAGEGDGIEFPDILIDKIAGIMDGFSFAYMQEAFVSTLLVIAGRDDEDSEETEEHSEEGLGRLSDDFELVTLQAGGEDHEGVSKESESQEEREGDGKGDGNYDDKHDPLDKYILWKEMKVQVSMLKKEFEKSS